MAILFKINGDILSPIIVDKLGFYYRDFISPFTSGFDQSICFTRGCFSLGDWGIISGLPYALKQTYPLSKIYFPKPNWVKQVIYPAFVTGQASHWEKAWENSETILKNNPYIDGYFDLNEVEGDIITDHYRVYNDNEDEPLVEQMLRFFGVSDKQILLIDSRPQLFFDKDEKEFGDSIINSYIHKKEFGVLLLTNSLKEYYDNETNYLLLNEIEKYKDLTFFYYGSKPLNNTIFNKIKHIDFKQIAQDLNLPNIPIRIQLYIKTKAIVNIGYQSGINDSVSRYSQVICTPSTGHLGSNICRGIKYLYNNKTVCI
jgi:hypothetical protein